MRILLLQDEIYLPSLGGGTKANRYLLEKFVSNGHQCSAVTRALTNSKEGPANELEFMKEMASRGISVWAAEADVFSYDYRGVRVEATHRLGMEQARHHLIRRIHEIQPDWVLVADDKRRFMLESAIHAAPDRVIHLLQTIVQLPFGPLAIHKSAHQTELMGRANAIVVISNFLKQYIERHSGLECRMMHLPVYGEGPFPMLARFDRGYITMINPCELKGASIFLALAREYPEIDFAAVPTWGANDTILRDLEELPNVLLLKPADEIEEIHAQTRALLVPSLWPETFGYVVPEAMLRGIPVLASNVGGLPEAKLGVDYLLPISPAERSDSGYVSPPQNIEPWSNALHELLFDSAVYDRCSQQSREAALEFVSRINITSCEGFLNSLTRT